MAPKVLVVVPAWGDAEPVRQCIGSLCASTAPGDYELLVLGDALGDAAEQFLGSCGVTWRLDRKVGDDAGTSACNRAGVSAPTGYVAFLGEGAVVSPGWLGPLVSAMEEDPQRGAVQPRNLDNKGFLADAGGLVFAGGEACIYGLGDAFPYAPKFSCRRAPDFVSGACVLVRQEAFVAAGGLGGGYTSFRYSQADLSFRLRRAGWSVLYEPAATVVQAQAVSGRAVAPEPFGAEDRERFALAWGPDLDERPRRGPSVTDAWAHRGQHGLGPGERGAAGEPAHSVLVVDLVPPVYDRASGSLRSFQMVRALRAAGNAVAYYAAGRAPERERYGAALARIGVPLYGLDPAEHAHLRGAPQAAVQAWAKMYTPDIASLCAERHCDVVVLTHWSLAEVLLGQVRAGVPTAKVIVDSVDLCFVREEREARLTGEERPELAERKERELAVYRGADEVVCVSQAEAGLLQEELPACQVAVVGNAQDLPGPGPGYEQREGLVMVANANHPPNVDGLRWFAQEVAPRLAQIVPGARLRVIGNDPVGALAGMASEHVEVLGWVPDTLPYLHRARVAVAPLRYGAGVKGKVSEALAAGLPVVGTPVAVEGMGLTAGEDVEVADDAEEFAAAVARVYCDPGRWRRLQGNGRGAAQRSAGLAKLAEQVAVMMASSYAPVPEPWTNPFAVLRSGNAAALAGPGASATPSVAVGAVPVPDLSAARAARTRAPMGAGKPAAPAQKAGSIARAGGKRPKRGRVTPRGAEVRTAGSTKPAEPGKPLLSACMIVKDEEKALPECLASLHGLVDEIVVYDTGSTDSTVALAKAAGARVIKGYWDEDFSRARNACLGHCRGEWILWVDADERFSCEAKPLLRDALRPVGEDALALGIYNLGEDPDPSNINVHRALRIFRKSRCQWYGSIHEQVDLLPGAEGQLMVRPLEGAHIDHIGYRADVVAERDKLARNLRLAESALAKAEAHPGQEGIAEMNLGRALAALGRFAEAQAHFDAALTQVSSGIALRATLLFCAQNLINTGHFERVVEEAQRLREVSQDKGLAYYMEGLARRRMGQPEEAVELLEQVGDLSNEDGFVFPYSLLQAELAGALLEAGRAGEAADQLAIMVQDSPDVQLIRSALKVFTAAGKSLEDLAAAMPESRLEKVAAALVLVPPALADPFAEALFDRFGPKPQLLAAAIHFAPMVAAQRALQWSARLRRIGMAGPCPLIAQAKIDLLEVPARVRAAVTAHAAFGDERGGELAKALAPGLHADQLAASIAEVCVLGPALLPEFARAAAGTGAPGAGPVGSPEERRRLVADALAAQGEALLSAQIANGDEALGAGGPAGAQLASLGADR